MRTALCLCCACLGVMVAGCRSVEKQVPEALALLAAVTLDGLLRIAVWIFLAGLAVKTWIAAHSK